MHPGELGTDHDDDRGLAETLGEVVGLGQRGPLVALVGVGGRGAHAFSHVGPPRRQVPRTQLGLLPRITHHHEVHRLPVAALGCPAAGVEHGQQRLVVDRVGPELPARGHGVGDLVEQHGSPCLACRAAA